MDRFLALHEAIERLAELPDTSELHIDAETKSNATRFLNLLGERDILMPRIFPQEGEALVFTWELGPRKRYITVAGDDVSGMDIDRKTFVRRTYDLPIDPPEKRAEWLPHLGSGPVSSSVPAEDDV